MASAVKGISAGKGAGKGKRSIELKDSPQGKKKCGGTQPRKCHRLAVEKNRAESFGQGASVRGEAKASTAR